MIKARNRKLSMLLVLAMLMTMFVGVGTASAAGTEYITLSAPTISTDSDDFQKLGRVSIDIDDVRIIPEYNADEAGPTGNIMQKLSAVQNALEAYEADESSENLAALRAAQNALTDAIAEASGEWFTISLPNGCEFEDAVGSANVLGTKSLDGIKITPSDNIKVLVIKISSKNSAEIKVAWDASDDERDGDMLVEFNGIKVKSGSGNVDATFIAPGDGAFPMGTATIAKIGSGSTTVMAKSVKTFGDTGGEIDTIIIAENRAGVFEEDETIELRLPKGFEWVDSGIVEGAWGMAGKTYTAEIKSGSDKRILVVDIDEDISEDAAGRLNIGTSNGFFEIKVNDTAKYGDIYVTITSSEDAVEKTELLVAKYGDYGVKVVEGTKEEVYSGRAEQELGKFYIEEQIEGSLIANRSLYLELPKGVKWQFDGDKPVIEMKSEDGTGIKKVEFSKVANTGDRKLRVNFEFDNGKSFSDEAVKLVVKKMEVRVEPSFTGEIAVTVSGNAGVEGEAVVAEAIKPITLKSEGPTKVEIGAMNQKAADILIIEEVDGAILDEYLDSTIFDEEYGKPQIVVSLPKGVEFYDDPVVKVEEGDLDIDDVDYFDGYLVITIDSSSSKKSVIRISDVLLTVDRTVPEGDVLAKFAGHKVDDGEIIGEGCSAFVNWATEESYGNVTVATTITPKQGGHAKFVIGSNIYEIGGIPYVMDAVPYIKDSRSYVPMRYLAQMLGAEVTWEQADQTVTLSNSEITVVFTIGSTSYTVNGEALTADVAPEIVNDRSFLPARFAAEAFGAQVGWDAALQTVIIIR